ncbi:Phosphatidylglycerophosphatase A [Alteracholeplasma palmae J233]|uniref:Phosphatidylglycerophosphatase A n=1 Tax=Alteracholeplasma palmae (strain ATCC 49389 / J233) TaxID=1318466 RepID=U4KP44_ALTPJ|nr:phosphatidylglycerophosphatase A [Alteracholeplasma palmae]CCV63975.1 Phosphatidylglycerophosphatase A [Alteracholeplasma palmae J233]
MNKEISNRNDEEKYDVIVKRLKSRGVELEDIAVITYDLQSKYIKGLKKETCLEHVKRVIMKREVQHAVLTGIELDVLAEENKLSEPLSTLLLNDYGLYGIDEILALSIVNVYGSIGLTNFGYVDKVKPGIIGKLDSKNEGKVVCNTFLDDIVGAIAAAAASSVAHRYAENDFVVDAYKK